MMQQIENAIRLGLRARGFRSRTIATSTGATHVMEAAGSGPLPPIALVHGLSSTGIHFLPMLSRLRERSRRVILPDLPGHGLSEIPPPGAGMPAVERSLTQMLDTVLTEPSIVFGSSLGAAAAIRYALAQPSRVRALVLSSPAGAPCDATELRTILDQFHIRNHAMALDFVDRLLDAPWAVRHVLALGVRARFAPESLQALLDSLTPADLLKPEDLSRLEVPSALIWGREDRILPRSHFEFFREHMPAGTHVEEPEGVGHAPYLQKPGVITDALLRFAERCGTPRPPAFETAA